MTDTQGDIPGQTTSPRIWLVLGDKPGDNAQIDIIVQALGLPYEIRRMLPRPEFVLGKPRFAISLDHLDLARSDKLEPPWPDLILTIGRRPSMAALWIQQQSGMHTRIVLLGRPKRWMDRFALIIVPSQYRMPPAANVLKLDLPLMRVDQRAIEQATGEWRTRLSTLPRPLTALFVGGPTKPFRMDAETARDLLRQSLAATGPGYLYISTSRRTPRAVVDTLQESLRQRQPLRLVRRRDRQSLSRPAGARGPFRRNRRQHLYDGRGRPTGQTAGDLFAAAAKGDPAATSATAEQPPVRN